MQQILCEKKSRGYASGVTDDNSHGKWPNITSAQNTLSQKENENNHYGTGDAEVNKKLAVAWASRRRQAYSTSLY